MIPVLLILIPLIAGLAGFFIKVDRQIKAWSLFTSLITLAISVIALTLMREPADLSFSAEWLPSIGSRFDLKMDGMSQLLCLLNGIAYPLVILATWKTSYNKPNNFFALMLLAQAGMMGVFVASDALVFYFFWELALIPMYFLCSQWGGERRIPVTFKFFIYTFVGSLLMLVGILFIYANTADRSFSMEAFYNTRLPRSNQSIVFWLIFVAFAIKMPVWPLHTWQPDTYQQAPAATTMILSGVMVKMGVFGMLRWLFPVMPLASFQWADVITTSSLIGVIYASLIAIRQNDLKRLIAYSSIAHMGLICAAAFAQNMTGLQGLMIQLFNHGINIIGLWVVADLIERKMGTRKISELGGLAQKAPVLAIMLVVVALANIALPLTNAFPGEFLMFNGIFVSNTKYNLWFVVMAGMGIILGAVYTLNMIRKIFFGPTNTLTEQATDIQWNSRLVLGIVILIIFSLGIYPNLLLNETTGVTETLYKKFEMLQAEMLRQ